MALDDISEVPAAGDVGEGLQAEIDEATSNAESRSAVPGESSSQSEVVAVHPAQTTEGVVEQLLREAASSSDCIVPEKKSGKFIPTVPF